MLRNRKFNLFFFQSLYDKPVLQIMQAFKEDFKMKNFKTWLVALMSALMLLGVATGCSDTTNTDDPETEEMEQNEEGTDEGTEDTEE
jgi:hypothetical protein